MVEAGQSCCLKFAEHGQHDVNCPAVQEFVYGVTIQKNGQKYKSVTGRSPSPANPDPLTVIMRVVDFLNGHFGTSYVVIEAIDESKLVEVAPGEFQMKEGANDSR